MSTLHYCDTDECQNCTNSYDKGIYSVEAQTAKALYKEHWLSCEFGAHFCRDCVEDYYNEEDEQLKIVNNRIELGKDFKEKRK